MRIATTEGLAGRRTAAALGLVLGVAVRRRGLGANIMAGFDTLGNGGALGEYREELAAVRQEALARMAALAAERGANAVIGVRFDTAETGHDMSELVAHGTAAIVEQGA